MTKKTCGVTLVELIVAVSILAIVSAAAGTALFSAIQSYAVTIKLQDDQYNARLALLAIARDAHRGVKPEDCVFQEGKLVLKMANNDTITYELVSGKLICTGGTPGAYAAVDLKKFTPKIEKLTIDVKDLDGASTGVFIERYQLTIDLEAQNNLKLSTTLALSRIPIEVTPPAEP